MNTNKQKLVIYTIGLILMWGFTWPILKIGLRFAPPLLFAGLRTLIGGIALTAIAVKNWRTIRFKESWHIYLISSVFNVILFFGLQNAALTHLPSGLLSVLVYFEPIMVGLLAWLWLHETLSMQKLIGLVLGFLGVAAISIKGLTGDISSIGILLALAGAISWAIGTVYWKRVQGTVDPLWLVAIPFTFGGVVLTGFGSLTETWSSIHWTLSFYGSLAYSCLIRAGFSWVIWLRLVHLGEVSRVAAF